jgi:hypothetical protein
MENDICGVAIGPSSLQGTWVRTVVAFQGPQLEITAFRGIVIGSRGEQDGNNFTWSIINMVARFHFQSIYTGWRRGGDALFLNSGTCLA